MNVSYVCYIFVIYYMPYTYIFVHYMISIYMGICVRIKKDQITLFRD